MTQTWSKQDFLQTFLASLPDGLAWNKDPNSILTNVSDPKMQLFSDVTTDCANLLIDAFPLTAVFMLPEWEASLGLPDPCLGGSPTIPQRQQQVGARFADNGGESIEYFEKFAGTLGFDIEIVLFRAPVAGIDIAGKCILFPERFNYTWQVNAKPSAAINNVLQCEFDARKKATTTIFYTYGLGVSGDQSKQSGTNISVAPDFT